MEILEKTLHFYLQTWSLRPLITVGISHGCYSNTSPTYFPCFCEHLPVASELSQFVVYMCLVGASVTTTTGDILTRNSGPLPVGVLL